MPAEKKEYEHRTARIREVFQNRFPSDGTMTIRFFEAPGTVKLIGDHLDYNGGFVLALCIDRSLIVGRRPNDQGSLRIYSVNDDVSCECPVDALAFRSEYGWANYALGIARVLHDQGMLVSGFDLVFEGNIPAISAGAERAAAEIATAAALTAALKKTVPPDELVRICRRAETEFLKNDEGVTDQYLIAHGREDNALLLDCRKLSHQYAPFQLSDIALAAGAIDRPDNRAAAVYRQRRAECAAGVAQLINYIGFIQQLRDVSVEQFELLKFHLPEVLMRRCAHVVYENVRVLQAFTCLQKGRYRDLGRLLNESHQSLKTLFEASTPEIDCLVETAAVCPGVYGSRMTGAGNVTLMLKDQDTEVKRAACEKFRARFGTIPAMFNVRPMDGVHEISGG